MAPILLVTGIPIFSIVVGVMKKDNINVFLMGFFRDLARIKAHKRRMKRDSNAMVAIDKVTGSTWDILFRRDDPLSGIDFSETECNSTGCSDSATSDTTFTAKEIEGFGSGENGKPIYLSIFGRVYDVSEGEKFYGPDSNYAMFAGKDVTRALCLGCKEPECLVRSTDGLSEAQIKEGKRWLSFFHMHDKYNYIGSMESSDSEAWLDALIEDTISQTDDNGDIVQDDEE